MTPDPDPDLYALAPFAPLFARPGFSFGQWAGGETTDGVMQLPYFAFSADADRFILVASGAGWVRADFSWPEWSHTPEAARLRAEPDAIVDAEAGDLAKLLTMLIRGERFCDGTLAQAFETGLLQRILDRSAVLAGIDRTKPFTLWKNWHHLVVHPGVDPKASGLYEWHVADVGIYVGKFTRWRRPFREYALNVERLLSGRPYRRADPVGFRRIHRVLAGAVRSGRRIELHMVENAPRSELAARELARIRERGTLNATKRD